MISEKGDGRAGGDERGSREYECCGNDEKKRYEEMHLVARPERNRK